MAITQSHNLLVNVQESSTDGASSTITVSTANGYSAGVSGDDLVKTVTGTTTQSIEPAALGFTSVHSISITVTGGTVDIGGSWGGMPGGVDVTDGFYAWSGGVRPHGAGQTIDLTVSAGTPTWSLVLVGEA